MPTSTTLAVDKAGGTDTFVAAVFALTKRIDGLSMLVAALEPQGNPVVLPPNVSARYFHSSLLHRLLWIFREGNNRMAGFVLLSATAFSLIKVALTYRRSDYDVIYAVGGPIAAVSGVVVKTLRRRPLAVHFHYTYNFACAPRIARFLVRKLYDQFDSLIGNCGMLGKDATAIGMPAARCYAVSNWVDQDRFRPLLNRDGARQEYQIAPDQTAFFFGGRFDARKHVDRIIDALTDFIEPKAVFLFAGDGVLEAPLRALAERNPNIRLLGTIAHDRLVGVHNACDIGFWNSIDIDYPGLTLIEAMASGLPAFTSNVTMNEHYPGGAVQTDFLNIPRYARLFPPTREGIRQAVREGVAMRDHFNGMREQIAAFAHRRFGFANAAKLVGILKQTAEEPRPRA